MRLARQVAVRRFPEETVMLNLVTGNYHGLDAMGGAFLEALQASADVGSALETLVAHTRWTPAGSRRTCVSSAASWRDVA